jgi:hypothetical protein
MPSLQHAANQRGNAVPRNRTTFILALLMLSMLALSGDASAAGPPAPQPPAGTPDFLTPPDETSGSSAIAGASTGATQTSEFMAGSIAVSVVFPESSGGTGNCSPADAQTETWSEPRRQQVLGEVQEGMQFWASRTGSPNVSFVIDDRGVQPTSCEPITRTARGGGSGERLWVADTLTAMGFPATTTNYGTGARAFAHSRREALSTDWAFTIFVVDSLNDADGTFSDGSFAYAYLNGPLMVMTSDNASWGISRMNIVAAHETGHVFGALDEYASSGCATTDRWGYLAAPNTSCNGGGDTTDISIMGEAHHQMHAQVDVSVSARNAIGWRNPASGIGGTVVDVVRTATVSLSQYQPDPTSNSRPTYAASAGNAAFPSEGPRRLGSQTFGSAPHVSISRFGGALWRMDGGQYNIQGISLTGPLGGEAQTYTFQPPFPAGPGIHIFQTQSVNNFGHTSNAASDTLAISSGVPGTTPTSTPTLLPTATRTATRTPTPVPASTSTPTASPQPLPGDTDRDGCADSRELATFEHWGGRRDPANPWDFYDLNGDRRITLSGDLLTLAGSIGNAGSPQYVLAFDRSSAPAASQEPDPSEREPWDLGPPDGSITIAGDLLSLVAQYGHSCA